MASIDGSDSRCSGRPRSVSILSIVVDDFDSKVQQDVDAKEGGKEQQQLQHEPLQKILDEVEHRKDEFRKLIDEHNAVIENLKKIEENAAATLASRAIST